MVILLSNISLLLRRGKDNENKGEEEEGREIKIRETRKKNPETIKWKISKGHRRRKLIMDGS